MRRPTNTQRNRIVIVELDLIIIQICSAHVLLSSKRVFCYADVTYPIESFHFHTKNGQHFRELARFTDFSFFCAFYSVDDEILEI